MGNEIVTQKRRSIRNSREQERMRDRLLEYSKTCLTSTNTHLGNSAYKVTLFIDTMSMGHVDKIVSCCDVRLTKVAYGLHDHTQVTKHLEAISPSLDIITPHICADCGDWKTYYKKCI